MRVFNNFIYVIFLINILISQNYNYSSEDWYFISCPKSIVAISEDSFNVYFATNNGFYRYDKILEDFQYDYNLSKDNHYHNIRHFYIDKNRGYYWIINNQGIYFKSAVSSIWREMSLVGSRIYSYYEIDDIGSSGEYLWFRSQDELFAYDPYSGLPIDWQQSKSESNMIEWGNSYNGISGNDLDISNYIINGEWDVNFKSIKSKDGLIINITVFMEDRDGNKWYGTDQGYVLKAWRSTNDLEMYSLGLPFEDITEAYFDKYGTWWFAGSRFKRTGLLDHNMYFKNDETPFISAWHEEENTWTHYRLSESEIIENQDINCILRINNYIYFGTMYGVLYYNLYNNEWNILNSDDGLNDSAVWEMIEYNRSIFVATAKGINEISTINQTVIPDTDNIFGEINKYNIYDFSIDSNQLYIVSEVGLIKLDLENGNRVLLSKKHYKSLNIINGLLTASDGSLWMINGMGDERLIKSKVHRYNQCGAYIWSIYNGSASLFNTSTEESWNYNAKDGILGNRIYDINCDQDWVWFISNKGVSFYNWSKYHKKN